MNTKYSPIQNRGFGKLLNLLVLAAALMSQPADASPTDQQKLAAANSDFSFRLLKELVKEQPAKNIFISPYSAGTCLQMVCNGAGGQTKAEMAKALGLEGAQQGLINTGASEIQASLNAPNTNVIL